MSLTPLMKTPPWHSYSVALAKMFFWSFAFNDLEFGFASEVKLDRSVHALRGLGHPHQVCERLIQFACVGHPCGQ